MKVVINNCFGGFGLSAEALKQLVMRNAKCIESITPKEYYGGNSTSPKARENWESEWKKDFEKYIDIGDGFMVDEGWSRNVFKDGLLWYFLGDSEIKARTDIDLVAVVESLGEKSSSNLSELKIVEIPDDVDFHIAEYDGNEHIAENHRTWS